MNGKNSLVKNGRNRVLVDDVGLPEFKKIQGYRKIIKRLNPEKTDIVLDVGTGAGHFAIKIAPKVKKVYAIDISPEVIKDFFLINVSSSKAGNVQSCVMDITDKKSFKRLMNIGPFNIIICRYMINYIDLPFKFIEDLYKLLDKNGKLLITTFVFNSPLARDNWVRIGQFREPELVNYYLESELEDMINENNLKIIYKNRFLFNRSLKDFISTIYGATAKPKAIKKIRKMNKTTKKELNMDFQYLNETLLGNFQYNGLDLICEKCDQ